MQYDNLDPLYKILCLALIFLVPLAPAWGLYKIAPADKFLAKGNFSGFRINATGSAAIYIVLFAAIYAQTSNILKDIDTSRVLKDQVDQLMAQRPWTIKYKLRLMTADSTREIDPLAYENIVKENSIVCMPGALHVGDDDKTLSFYVDDQQLASMSDPIDAQVMVKGYGTSRVPVSKKSACFNLKDRIITISPTIYMGASNTAQENDLKNNHIAVLGPQDGSVKPPVIHQ